MQNANHPNDSEFNEALKAWEPPEVSSALDHRVLEAYRQHTTHRSWWERFFTTSVRIPLPIVALQAVLLLMAGGGFLAVYITKAEEVLPIAQNTLSPTITPTVIEVPVVTEKVVFRTVFRAQKQSLLRTTQKTVSAPVLPMSAQSRPTLTVNAEASGGLVRAELYAPKLQMEWAEAAIASESKPLLPASLSYHRIPLPEPLPAEWRTPVSNDFGEVVNPRKPKVFEGRISRTVSRASEWVTKPLEKTEALYRWIPNALPAVNSFVSPAKNACFSPFRSKPDFVNVN
jgi:hypothetical protein